MYMCATSHNLVITIIKSKIKIQWKYIKETTVTCKCYGRGAGNFSSPLQKITPETMGFQITDFDSKPMAGQIIQSRLLHSWV
jgi:hypothetical protein